MPEAAAVTGEPAETLCTTVMAAMLGAHAPTGDIAILVLRRTGSPGA